jgi:hypothetical protein
MSETYRGAELNKQRVTKITVTAGFSLETVDHHFSELKKGKTLSTSKNILQI